MIRIYLNLLVIEYPECCNNKDEKDLNACIRCRLVHYCSREHKKLY